MKKYPSKEIQAYRKKINSELNSQNNISDNLFKLIPTKKDKLTPEWHWTSEEKYAPYAWYFHFGGGHIYYLHKSYKGSAVAVRLIPLTGDGAL